MLLRPLAYVSDSLDGIYYFGLGIWFLVMACLHGFTQAVCGMKKSRDMVFSSLQHGGRSGLLWMLVIRWPYTDFGCFFPFLSPYTLTLKGRYPISGTAQKSDLNWVGGPHLTLPDICCSLRCFCLAFPGRILCILITFTDYFSGCSDKIFAKSNSKEEGSIWLTVSVAVASSWQGACGHDFSHLGGPGLDMWLRW